MSYDVQKASMWKRISAYLFDFILLGILTVGIATLLSFALNYDSHLSKMNGIYTDYANQYGISLTEAVDTENLTEEELLAIENNEKAFEDALYSDDLFLYSLNMVANLSFIIIIFSILTAHLILEFTVPMLFKNGQTLGKKVFGVAVMRVDGVKIDGPLLFTRAILGKCVVETLIPILFLLMIFFGIIGGLVGLIAIGAIYITDVVMLIATKENYAIHDMVSGTVTVDMASQLIFDSPEALLEYKQKVHAEAAENAQYF